MQRAYPWVTPKIFGDLTAPAARVAQFFDHYADWFARVDEVVLTFCASNGDHILAYPGVDGWGERFDWGRYNSYVGTEVDPQDHNLHWLTVAREGRRIAGNPYHAGPAFVLSEQHLDYERLAGLYAAFRGEAARRGIRLVLLEYLEPGSEFCGCVWKTERHPEAAAGLVDAGGNLAPGLIDVATTLRGDSFRYAAYPEGIPEGEETGRFVARQTAAFVRDLGLDGVTLGNQFGLIGLWRPSNAVELDDARRAAITSFFTELRSQLGEGRIYWQDSFWPVEAERTAWGMSDAAYAALTGIIVSTFAVLVQEENLEANVLSKLALRDELLPDLEIVQAVDFVDPWYWYRVYLDSPHFYHRQRALYGDLRDRLDGIMFFANDTFGHFVMPDPLSSTLALLPSAVSTAARP